MTRSAELSAQHQQQIAQWLARPHKGLTYRAVNLPPRSGKTSMAQRLLAEANEQKETSLYVAYTEPVARAYGKEATVQTAPDGAMLGHIFDLVVLDDPMGGGYYDARDHPARVENMQGWLEHVVTKLKPNGLLVLFESRFAKDDTTGLLQKLLGDRLEHVFMPAIDDAGASFWPEWWPVEKLREVEWAMTNQQWSGLYQQNPTA